MLVAPRLYKDAHHGVKKAQLRYFCLEKLILTTTIISFFQFFGSHAMS